jgi:hypothetical protein
VLDAAATARPLLPHATLLPQYPEELGHVVQQKFAAADERDADDDNATGVDAWDRGCAPGLRTI